MKSRIDAKGLHDYNIIFVGAQKTVGILNSYFDQSEYIFNVTYPYQYMFQTGEKDLLFKPKGNPGSKHTDYGFIIKYPGRNNNTSVIFSGLLESTTSESLIDDNKKIKNDN